MSDAMRGTPIIETRISDVADGRLLYRNVPIDKLFEHDTFADVVWRLWHGAPPTPAQRTNLEVGLAASWDLPRDLTARLRALPAATPWSVVLREAVAAVAVMPPRSGVQVAPDAVRLLGMLPNVAAQWHHIAAGRPHFVPRVEGSLASRFLHAVRGEPPSDGDGRALDRAFILYADYGLTASTLAARLAAAAEAPLTSAVSAALCVVDGPLHGGVAADIDSFLESIASPADAGRAVDPLLRLGQTPPGFGPTLDPRATLFRRLAAGPGRGSHLKTADALAEIVHARTAQLPSADLYAVVLLRGLGLPRDLVGVVFALGRLAGWIAHAQEQQSDNRLAAPTARYLPANAHTVD